MTQNSKTSLKTLDPSYLALCRTALKQEQEKSLADTNYWEHVDRAKIHADWHDLYSRLAPMFESHAVTSKEILDLMQAHFDLLACFYPPSREAYLGVAMFYEEDPGMREFHQKYHPHMIEFMQDAMFAYSEHHWR